MIGFNAFFSPWLIVGLLGPISVFLIWQEWKREFRFRFLRMIAVFIMMLSLAAILLRPSLAIEKSRSILLLTRGFEKNKVDSLLKQYPDLITKRTSDAEFYRESSPIQSSHDLSVIGADIRFIAGHGLKDYELDLMKSKFFDFLPGSAPEGITDISFPKNIVSNRRSNIEGIYKNNSGANWLYLNGPQGKEDSTSIPTSGEFPFSLSFSPRQSGNVLYEVIVTDSAGNRQKENIPLTITEAKPLRLLIIQSYPTSEMQYLKNFLSQKKHELVVRSQLSQNNFRYEYANRSPVQINTITKNIIDEFDVLITDDEVFRKLSSAEKSIIKEEIESGGLGLLNLPNNVSNNTKASEAFPFETITVKTDTTEIKQGSKRFELPAIPLRVREKASVTSLIKNNSGILSGYTFKGGGKIGFQLLKETYRLSLSGDSVEYSELWSPLIEQIARPHNESSSIEITSSFPHFMDEPLDIQVISSTETVLLKADSIRIPLQEDVIIDDVWHAKIWGDTPGWHRLQTDDAVLPYYISKNGEWETLSIFNKMTETLRVRSKDEKISNGEKVREQKEIPPLAFYLLFILSAGFIWLAPKL